MKRSKAKVEIPPPKRCYKKGAKTSEINRNNLDVCVAPIVRLTFVVLILG